MRLLPRALAATTVKLALKQRVLSGYPLDRPCDIYKLIAEKVTLQFIDVPTLEGMYLEDDEVKRICVCALRPAGRQRLTAAHEYGHWAMGHGTSFDVIEDARSTAHENSVEERVAELFAYYILMPAPAVHAGFAHRGFNPRQPSSHQVYAVANWLGVGYRTLVQHMTLSLGLITSSCQQKLLRQSRKSVKSAIIGGETINDVFELDDLWAGCTLHLVTGDHVHRVASEDSGLLTVVGHGRYRAGRCGSTTIKLSNGGSVRAKVSRPNFVGFYEYRYLEEAS